MISYVFLIVCTKSSDYGFINDITNKYLLCQINNVTFLTQFRLKIALEDILLSSNRLKFLEIEAENGFWKMSA